MRNFDRRSAGALLGAATGATLIGAGPASGGARYRLPEESRRHVRTFLQWPVDRRIYRDADFLFDAQATLARLADAISAFEPVVMLAGPEHRAAIRKRLTAKAEIWPIETNDLWCRDSGPLFVIDDQGGAAVADIRFNGWGGKQPHERDARIARAVAERLGLPVVPTGLVGEGGGIETDGAGLLLAHASSWVNANRNAGDQAEIGAKLMAALGARAILWAPGVKGQDITDAHIDALARFARPGEIVIQMPAARDPHDPWSRSAFETYARLAAWRDTHGGKLALTVIPEPRKPRVRSADFLASYVNYYVCNGAVICARFGDRERDAEAAALLGRLHRGREIVALDVDALGELGGGIHCATREQPEPL